MLFRCFTSYGMQEVNNKDGFGVLTDTYMLQALLIQRKDELL